MPGSLQRLVVVSDLHIAPEGPLNNFHAGSELAQLVGSLDPAGSALVFAGDFLDCLQVPGRPHVLDLEGAPGLLRRLLAEVAGRDWGADLLAALRAFVRGGGQWVVIPGNHDPELFHPEARRVLREASGLEECESGLALHNAAEPWRAQVGPWTVVVGHGHLGDSWNRISPETLHRALSRGEPALALPPGSLLVLETINAFKRACDPRTGEPRFPFVDLLKPEGPWVPLLLMAFDLPLALSHLPGVAGHAGLALWRALAGRLRGGPTLRQPVPAEDDGGAPDLPAELAEAIAAALTSAEAAAPRAVLDRFESALTAAAEARPGRLAGAGGVRGLLLRAAHRLWHDGGSFFDPSSLSTLDGGIVREHLPEDSGPRVVVAGHTHAAREVRLPGDRLYLNCGTWTDLLRVPDGGDGETLARWAEEVGKGVAPRLWRLTYADITPAGPRLGSWESEEHAPKTAGER
jgi:UDP-2,3-diacylglucosamine pyrophosphatase LpxH